MSINHGENEKLSVQHQFTMMIIDCKYHFLVFNITYFRKHQVHHAKTLFTSLYEFTCFRLERNSMASMSPVLAAA